MDDQLITVAQFLTSMTNPPFHALHDYEILFITEGEVELQLPAKNLQARRGDVVFLSSFESYHTVIQKTPYKRYVLGISREAIDKKLQDRALLSMLKNHPAEFDHCIHVRDISVFKNIFDNMVSEYNSDFKKPYSECLQLLLIKELLIRAYRTQNRSALFMTNSSMRDLILSIQDYIDKHYKTDLKINVICQDLHINPSHFSRMFKGYVGLSPKQYLTHVRLNNIKNDLINTARSITDIALENGFIDINNFTRTFRKAYGVTPSQYRDEQEICHEPANDTE